MNLNRLTGTPVFNLFRTYALGQQRANRNDWKKFFLQKLATTFVILLMSDMNFSLTGLLEYLANSHVNAKNINSFKAGFDSLPVLAAKAYQAQ